MMFRVKGKRIQCLRSEYLPEKKRTQAKLICSLFKWEDAVPEEVRQLLTKEEVDSLREYMSSRSHKMAVERAELKLLLAAESLDGISSALQCDALDHAELLSPEAGAELFAKIAELRKQLKRAGYRPKTPEKTQKTKKDKRQDELKL